MPLVPHVSSGQIVASSWGNLVADQVVMRFTTAAQRTSQLTAPVLNQLTSRDDAPGVIEFWNGTTWLPVAGGELAYDQITASVTVSNTTAAVPAQIIAGTSRAYDAAPIVIEFYASNIQTPAAASAQIHLNLWDGSTDLGYIGNLLVPQGMVGAPCTVRRRLTPTAGTHQYGIKAWIVPSGNGSVQAGAGGLGNLPPAYLRITRA